MRLDTRYSPYNCGVSGRATGCVWVNDHCLSGKSNRKITCDGYIKMIIPNVTQLYKSHRWDFLQLAQSIHSVAVHEFTHIKDNQKHITNHYDNRRKLYRSRPCEILARRVAKRAINHLSTHRQNLIINLGLWLENQYNTKERTIKPEIYFTCVNPSCTYNHLWYFGKRIPSYIRRGLFKACECGEKRITQCDFDKNRVASELIFVSIL